MKTKKEIKEEIIELYGANKALNDAMNHLHSILLENAKKLYALNHMLKAMKEGDKND